MSYAGALYVATEGTPEEWRKVLDLNVVALCLCTREAVASMRERGVDDGHIIHINRWVCDVNLHQAGSVRARSRLNKVRLWRVTSSFRYLGEHVLYKNDRRSDKNTVLKNSSLNVVITKLKT